MLGPVFESTRIGLFGFAAVRQQHFCRPPNLFGGGALIGGRCPNRDRISGQTSVNGNGDGTVEILLAAADLAKVSPAAAELLNAIVPRIHDPEVAQSVKGKPFRTAKLTVAGARRKASYGRGF